ncbi:phage portal protein [Bacillus thuringiensis]|uniref:phage portal protein n=1 Tax=Bacillus thuringiensis TaxID=1428 RepID=UPI001F0AED16|nr:phage portal protein [Bacillus thuringiensis]
MNPEKMGAVLFQPENVQMEDKSPESKQMDTRDIKAIAKDMLEFFAPAFHIPPAILSGISDGGTVSSASNPTGDLDNFILFGFRPLGELIVTEYNKKMFTHEQYLAKTYIKFNMDTFKLVDINKLAKAVDKMFAVGGGFHVNQEGSIHVLYKQRQSLQTESAFLVYLYHRIIFFHTFRALLIS